MKEILFDGNEDKLNLKLVKVIGEVSYLSPNEVLEKSVLLSNSNKPLIDLIKRKTNNELVWVNFGFYRGSLGLPVYILNLNLNSLIYEFGEYQPGRYILNQLAVIEGQ
jgi:hypothetical protein